MTTKSAHFDDLPLLPTDKQIQGHIGNHVIMWTCSLDEPISSVFCFCPALRLNASAIIPDYFKPKRQIDSAAEAGWYYGIYSTICRCMWAYLTASLSKRETVIHQRSSQILQWLAPLLWYKSQQLFIEWRATSVTTL